MNFEFSPISINSYLVMDDIQEHTKKAKAEDYVIYFLKYCDSNILSAGFCLLLQTSKYHVVGLGFFGISFAKRCQYLVHRYKSIGHTSYARKQVLFY